MKRLFNYAIKLTIVVLIFFTFLIFSAFWYFSHGLPSLKKLSVYEPSVLSRVYDDSGKLVAEYSLEKRLFIKDAKILDGTRHPPRKAGDVFDEDNDRGEAEELVTAAVSAPPTTSTVDKDEDDALSYFAKLAEE